MAENKVNELVGQIETLTVLELNDLVKALEEKFGVSAAMAAAPAVSAPGALGAAGETEVEEKTEWAVELTEAGAQKIAVIKALREINPALGLKEAKDMAEQAPKVVLENVKKEPAEEAKKKLEAAGAKVVLK